VRPDQFKWFVAGQAFWFAAFGLQAVMFPYLVVSVLQQSPENVGIAQLCLMAPSIALMVPGGILADSYDLRILLIRMQFAAVIPVTVLALVTGAGLLSFAMLLGFALAQGSLQALVMPTRDALLGRIAGTDVQRAVTTAMTVQFLAQIVGFVLAGSASYLGVHWLLAAQAILYAIGASCARKMAPAPPIRLEASATPPGAARAQTRATVWAELKVAFALVAKSPRIGPVTLIMVGIGFCFIGVFSVVVPIMVRDVYLGGSVALAMVNGSFVGGVISATLVLRARRAVSRQGRAIFLSACIGAITTGLFATHPPVVVFYLLISVFGAGAGVVMSLGRTLVQEAASPAHRARILAIYSVAFLGAAPIGSVVVGQVAEVWGLAIAAAAASAAMSALLVFVLARTEVWRIRREVRTH
jgi:MFS family permease